MIEIIVCEDNQSILNMVVRYIKAHLEIKKYDMEIVLAATADAVIEHVKNTSNIGLYFLDIGLEHKIDGIELAEIIRQYDPRCFIVFVTTHGEAMRIAYERKVAALDFILKDEVMEMKNRVASCIDAAFQRYSIAKEDNLFVYKVFGKVVTIEKSEILYFETSGTPNKIRIYSKGSCKEFYGEFKELEKTLGNKFFRCHQSYVVNLDQIKEVDPDKKIVKLKDGSTCLVASQNLQKIKKYMLEKH